MILDLERFQAQARPRWSKLESLLLAVHDRPDRRLKPAEAELLQEYYAQTAADLNRVAHGALAPELRQYLDRLVARAYAELYYAPPARSEIWQPRRWLRIFTAPSAAMRPSTPSTPESQVAQPGPSLSTAHTASASAAITDDAS